jgi:two-component system sensor histidine kinase FlrB
MLPSSHTVLINAGTAEKHGSANDIAGTATPQPALQSTPNAGLLADAFSEFIATSSRLETSYRELQAEVYGLGLELADRNADLNVSLAKNERMRLALQQIVDSMPCGVIVIEREGEISVINPETGRLLGLDLLENAQAVLSVHDITKRSGVNLTRLLAGQSGADMEQEVCVQGLEGKRWLEIRNRRLFHLTSREGKPDQTILILRDITAQKRAEQDRESGRNAMALAEIATVLAHEIRNPLASLELFAELIESDVERQQDWISNLRAGIRSLAGTVNNVLSFHSFSSPKLVPLPLAAVVAHAIEFILPLADQAGICLEWIDESCGLLIEGHEGTLQQVLLNLFSNAIRHTSPGGCVTVSLRLERDEEEGEVFGQHRGCAVLACADDGCGIRPEQIAHIFEPGFSGNGNTSGLGLAVCDRIMKQHRGHISVSNVLPSGACFVLEFPALAMTVVPA